MRIFKYILLILFVSLLSVDAQLTVPCGSTFTKGVNVNSCTDVLVRPLGAAFFDANLDPYVFGLPLTAVAPCDEFYFLDSGSCNDPKKGTAASIVAAGGGVTGSGTGGVMAGWIGCGPTTVLGDTPLTFSGGHVTNACGNIFARDFGGPNGLGSNRIRFDDGVGQTKLRAGCVDFMISSATVTNWFIDFRASCTLQTLNGALFKMGNTCQTSSVNFDASGVVAGQVVTLAEVTGVMAIDNGITADFSIKGTSINGELVNADQLRFLERSSDPTAPTEGTTVLWMSNGVGAGDDGDIMISIQAGCTTKTTTLIDFSVLP